MSPAAGAPHPRQRAQGCRTWTPAAVRARVRCALEVSTSAAAYLEAAGVPAEVASPAALAFGALAVEVLDAPAEVARLRAAVELVGGIGPLLDRAGLA